MGQGQPAGQSCGECCEPGLQLQQRACQRCRPAAHLLVQLRGGEGEQGTLGRVVGWEVNPAWRASHLVELTKELLEQEPLDQDFGSHLGLR